MNLILYPRLNTRSKKSLTRKNTQWGKAYSYRPRGNLLARLARETGMTVSQVLSQLKAERQYLLNQNSLP